MQGILNTCEGHGDDAIVVYWRDYQMQTTCPVCDAIRDLENEIEDLKEKLENLE